MRINWNENPLRTTVELTPDERTIFLLKARILDLTNSALMATFHLSEQSKIKGRYDPHRAHTLLRGVLDMDMEAKDELGTTALEAIESQEHLGDCVSLAMTCEKCLAESMLGINTLSGLTQQAASVMRDAFGEDGDISIEQAIIALKNFNPQRTDEFTSMDDAEFERHAVGWRAEANQALEWLIHYKDTTLAAHRNPTSDVERPA